MLNVEKTDLEGVLLIKPDVFRDFRGDYAMTYNEALYRERGIPVRFVEDDISMSHRGVLRGIHGDAVTWKLVSCLLGEFLLAVVNCDRDSPQFGKWSTFLLSEQNRHQVLVPAKFGNAHLVLSERAIFCYKQSAYYDRSRQFTYRWDEPRFGIQWPTRTPVLSERDADAPYIRG